MNCFYYKISQLIHWGPIFTLSIITMISSTGLYCDLMWWPVTQPGGVIHLCIYLTWLALILYTYFSAAFIGPGFVPYHWYPERNQDRQYLQFCKECQGYKAPRSHHCRKCRRCVMKMDHHCPWINTCCGHRNHAFFIYFLLFAPIGCSHAAVILIVSLYRSLYVHHYVWQDQDVPLIYLGIFSFILVMFSIGLAIGVTISVGMLFVIQVKSVLKNETGIESWIITKALHRRYGLDEDYVYPYNLGWRKNVRELLSWSGLPHSDGFTWPVVEGCDQFSFTMEQLSQKEEKRERSVRYTIIEPFNGAIVPLSKGCCVLCNTPLSDEPRIAVTGGDMVSVTRWKKHWLYGEKVADDKNVAEVRGWFPRRCAAQFIGDNDHQHDKTQ